MWNPRPDLRPSLPASTYFFSNRHLRDRLKQLRYPAGDVTQAGLEEPKRPPDDFARAVIRIEDVKTVPARRVIHYFDHRILGQRFGDESVDGVVQSSVIPACAPNEDGRKRMTALANLFHGRRCGAGTGPIFISNSLHSGPGVLLDVGDAVKADHSTRIGRRFT